MKPQHYPKGTKRIGAIMLVIGWIIAMTVGTMLLQNTLYQDPVVTFDPTQNTIAIPQSRDGHFRVAGTINNVPVLFLLDTGASRVAVPQSIAIKAKLPQQQQISIGTAAGTIQTFTTNINHLSISEIKLQNIAAVLMPNVQDGAVLLGMNVLKYFKINMEDDVMHLELTPN